MSWDPTPGQRKLAFVGAVVALAAAGVYFTLPAFRSAEGAAPTPASPRTGTTSGAPPAASPTAGPTSADVSSGDVEGLLPMSADQVAEAVEVARRFTAAYTTYRYDEDPEDYRRRLASYVTAPIAGEIEEGASAASAGRDELARQEVVVTAEASVEGTRLISPDSVVAIVRADQTIASTKGTTRDDQRLAVTVVDDGGWKVSNVAPAGAGNEGDVSQ